VSSPLQLRTPLLDAPTLVSRDGKAALTVRDAQELCELWLLLETAAIETMTLMWPRRRGHIDYPPEDCWIARLVKVHAEITRRADNVPLRRVLAETLASLQPYLRLIPADAPGVSTTFGLDRVVDAIERSDASHAVLPLRAHAAKIQQAVLRALPPTKATP